MFKVFIARYRRKEKSKVLLVSPCFKTIGEAIAWRDAHEPPRLKSGVKPAVRSPEWIQERRKLYAEKHKERMAKEKAKDHKCILCQAISPDTVCAKCKQETAIDLRQVTNDLSNATM